MKLKNSGQFSFGGTTLEDDVYFKLSNDRILFLKEDINSRVATDLVASLVWMDGIDPNQEITLCINSPGGTISDGLLTIYDTIQFIRAPVKTICIGEAYSGAAVILAAGTVGKRYAYPNAEIMIHGVQVSLDMQVKQSELEKESRRTKKLNNILMEIIAKHTGQSVEKVKKDCAEDRYLTAKEAVEYGIIDDIIKPQKRVPISKINKTKKNK